MATALIQARWPQIVQLLPEVVEGPGTMLYVGANKDRHHYMPEFYAAGYKITLLEVWEPYLQEMAKKEMVRRAVLGSVVQADHLELGESMFDIAFWWHGPEHVSAEDMPQALFALEHITRKYVILGCPWGRYPQGIVHGNPYETHVQTLLPEDFQKYGYQTRTLGTRDVIDSNVLAWKKLRFQTRRRSHDFSKWAETL